MTESNVTNEWIANLKKELAVTAGEKQFDYGKWVLASLLTVHLGALLLISQAGENSEKLFQASGIWLIYGVITALFTGGLAWINFTLAAVAHWKSLVAYTNRKEYEPTKLLLFGINTTFWASPILAIASLVLFLIAARCGLAALR